MEQVNIVRERGAAYVRNFIFGVEDSLVSTVGLLSGIAIAQVPRPTIFLTGMVLIFVEAFSMAIGSFLAESSAESYLYHKIRTSRRSLLGGLVMFTAYFISGFIPLLPYRLLPAEQSFTVSVTLSLGALFILGTVGGKIARVNWLKTGLRMFLVGGIAIAVGILAGTLVNGKM